LIPKIYELHAEICQTLANPKRLEILDLLSKGEKSVSELVALLDIRQANLSQHLAILRQKGVVATRRTGTHIYYRISNKKIVRAYGLLKEVLLERLAEAGELVKELKKINF